MIEVNCALGRIAETRGRRKTPGCPAVLGLVAHVAHSSQGSRVPPAWNPEPSQGALATHEVCCQLRQESFLGTHPSQ